MSRASRVDRRRYLALRVSALPLIFLALSAGAQTVWNGSASADWHDPLNWSAGVPTALLDAAVFAGSPNAPVIALQPAACRGFTLSSGATLGLFATLNLSGSATFNGLVTGTARVRINGAGTIGGTAALPRLEVASPGLVQLNGVTVAGDVVLLSGRLRPLLGTTITIQGKAEFTGGIIETPGGLSTFDIHGDLMFNGATCIAAPRFVCRGGFHVDAGFQPTNLHVVELAGVGVTTVSSSAPNGVLSLSHLVLKNGIRRAAGNLRVVAASFSIEAGAEFDVSVHDVAFPGLTMAVQGSIRVGAGGVLRLPAANELAIAPAGHLRLFGTPTNPARIAADGAPGHRVTVHGEIAAQHFAIEDTGAVGLVLTATATRGVPPQDLRSGTLSSTFPTTPSALLTLERPLPEAFFDLCFEHTTSAASNVSVVSGSTVTFYNFTGNHAGAAHESDPAGLINWSALDVPALSSATLDAGAERAMLRFVFDDEGSALAFRIERATSSSGPWTVTAGDPAMGAGMTYEYSDTGLSAGVNYYYRVIAELPGVDEVVVFVGSTTPFGAALPGILDVGPAAPFADVAAALAAAGPNDNVIRLAPGVYPPFTVDATAPARLRIIAVPAGAAIIDTSSQPVRVIMRGAATTTELVDLVIGTPSTTGTAVEVNLCAGLVQFDDVTVDGGTVGVSVTSCTALVIQDGSLSGVIAASFGNGSVAQVTRTSTGTLNVLDTSSLTTCGALISNTNVAVNAAFVPLLGVMPHFDVPRAGYAGEIVSLSLESVPNEPWFLGVATGARHSNVFAPTVELALLVDPEQGGMLLLTGVFDGTGASQRLVRIPPVPWVIGFTFYFQFVTFEPTAGAFRFSDLAGLLVLP